MRQDFEVPVFLGIKLTDFDGIKGISPEDRYAGMISRKDGKTILGLSGLPMDSEKGSEFIYTDLSGERAFREKNLWYATTWDGKIQFVIRELYNIEEVKQGSRRNSISYGATSKWEIMNFSIATQFMLKEKIYQATVDIDHTFYFFGITSLVDEKVHELKYTNLEFERQSFSLYVVSGYSEHSSIRSSQRNEVLNIVFKFKKYKNREFVYRLIVQFRNLIQVLTDKSTGINRIELNADKSIKIDDAGKVAYRPKDERENWNLVQSFLPKQIKEDVGFSEIFKEIKQNFYSILASFFDDDKLQELIQNYLLIGQYNVPVSTAIVTLISGVDTYYRDARYSNGKKKKKSIEKLKMLMDVIDNPQELIYKYFGITNYDIESLLTRIVDERDYFVHGVKANAFDSYTSAAKDLMKFKVLMKQAIVLLVCNPEIKTEF